MTSRLITPQLAEQFKLYPLYSQDGKKKDAICQCVFFIGKVRWYVLEGQLEGNDFTLYLYVSKNNTTNYQFEAFGIQKGWKTSMRKICLLIAMLVSVQFVSAQRKTVIVETPQNQVQDDGMVLKRKVAIGRFSNETQYAKGIFYDKENDPMGKQALDILSAKLASSGKFILLERSDLSTLLEECQKNGGGSSTIGADYMIIGSITEYGRKNTGKNGVFSSQKTQTVEAAVAIRLVDVSSGLIIYSDEAKGSAELTTKTTMGVGGSASFDATLSDKAISEAIGQLVENIINKCTNNPWKTYIISCDNDGTLIAGGQSQGIKEGMVFAIKTKGKKVKNPQTGIMINLPGKQVGTATIVSTGGDTPETEYSFATLSTSENINDTTMGNYIIEQIK